MLLFSYGDDMDNINKFLDYLKYEKHYSDHTVISYRNDLVFFNSFIKNVDISCVTLETIRGYLKFLYDCKMKTSSISRKISSLKSYFKYLESENIILNNPMTLVSNPKGEKHLPNYLNYNDLDKLLNTPDISTLEGIRDALILEMLYSTGIRVSELVSIKLLDIDFDDCKILILGKGNKERYTYYGKRCGKLLDLYLNVRNSDSVYLFVNKHGDMLNTRTVRAIVSNAAMRCGIKVHVSPHTLRHTYATHMLNEGADLKSVGDLLGHESLSTTQIYTHVSNERLRNVYLNSHPRA